MAANSNSINSSLSTTTIDVGGAAFPLTKTISKDDELLVAKGKSYLSYFYVGVCSSVLYLPQDIEAVDSSIISQQQSNDDISTLLSPIALEIYYHKPARATDLQWATTKFIEANLPPNYTTISDLPLNIQHSLTTFNNLYQNISVGDRYTLQYIPKVGIQLLLNDVLLGVIGNDMELDEQYTLAKLIYSVWFGLESPFSESMKEELLTPIELQKMLDVKDEQQSTEEKIDRPLCNTRDMIGSTRILATDSRQDIPTSNSTEMTEEEKKLLDSIGILDLLKEEGGDSSQATADSSPSIHHIQSHIHQTAAPSRHNNIQQGKTNTSYLSSLSRIWNRISENTDNPIGDEDCTDNLIRTSISSAANITTASKDDTTTEESKYNPILFGIGATLFIFPHLAVLLSLPPVLQRRGAPYLPTFGTKLNAMFVLIRNHTLQSNYMKQKIAQNTLRFVDLGSGDGRVVFRAARENLFAKSIGYEINPALHILANLRRLITPQYWNSTSFYMRDIWKIQLNQYDVVAVYGLAPIMDKLGKKLEKELQPGSIVVSNVFSIPGWKVSDTSSKGKEGVFVYKVPDCFRSSSKVVKEET